MIVEADDISKNAYIKLIKYFLNIKLSIFIHHTTKKGTEMFCTQDT